MDSDTALCNREIIMLMCLSLHVCMCVLVCFCWIVLVLMYLCAMRRKDTPEQKNYFIKISKDFNRVGRESIYNICPSNKLLDHDKAYIAIKESL